MRRINMLMSLPYIAGAGVALAGVAPAQAQDFTVGQIVTCDGQTGRIIRTEPRPGWDEPFYVVELQGGSTTWEIKCLPSRMRAAAAVPPRRTGTGGSARTASPRRATPAADTTFAPLKLGRAPDGTYSCSKISAHGTYVHVGTLRMRGGRGTLVGMPAGWTIRDIYIRGKSPRGEMLVAVDYRSSAGFNDRVDCVPG